MTKNLENSRWTRCSQHCARHAQTIHSRGITHQQMRTMQLCCWKH